MLTFLIYLIINALRFYVQLLNFADLDPIEKGLELVGTNQLSTESLMTLLKLQFPLIPCGNDNEEEEEVYSAIEGGGVMKGDNQVIFMPQCCTGFYDYREWLEVKKRITFVEFISGILGFIHMQKEMT